MELVHHSPGAPPQLRLSELAEGGVPVAWHEAVAVARVVALAAQRQAPPVALPGFSQILLDTTGDLIAEGAEPVGDGAVRHVAQILGRLLPAAGTPEELRALQKSASAAPSQIDINEFITSLTFFARPEDTSELAALAARALAFAESRARDVALAELTRKAREAVATAPPLTKADDSGRSSSIRRLVGVAIVVGILAGAALAWRLAAAVPPALPTAGGTSVAELARRVQDEVAVTARQVADRLGLVSPPAAVVGRDRELPRVRRARQSKAAGASRPPLPAEYAYGLVPDEGNSTRWAGVPWTAPSIQAPLPPDDTVYTAADGDVTLPTLVRPQMPVEPAGGVSVHRPGVLELVIGSDGLVERARLVPASNRLQDRMMVSAAKTWRFEPAAKEGRPVRYRMHLPITW